MGSCARLCAAHPFHARAFRPGFPVCASLPASFPARPAFTAAVPSAPLPGPSIVLLPGWAPGTHSRTARGFTTSFPKKSHLHGKCLCGLPVQEARRTEEHWHKQAVKNMNTCLYQLWLMPLPNGLNIPPVCGVFNCPQPDNRKSRIN